MSASGVPQGRLKGHALQNQGQPFLKPGCCGNGSEPSLNVYDSIGHGLCECGAMSSCQDAGSYRREWHRQHKLEARS